LHDGWVDVTQSVGGARKAAPVNFTSFAKACGIALCLLAQPLTAGPFEDGLAAHARGDFATAVQVWKQLAEQGNAPAQYNLANMYAEGHGMPQDQAEALKWYRRAAGRGHAAAQLSLAVLYDRGQGVPQSLSRAMKWYRRAAEQGDAVAQTTLGRIYGNGQGVPQNYWQAVKWYQLAAEQSVPVAQTNLGIMYQHGRGVPQDYMQAHKWFSLAAATGDVDAAKNRDAVSAKMTPEQIGKAQKLAQDWSIAKEQERAARCQTLNLEDCK
jgi:TPR repeat protein